LNWEIIYSKEARRKVWRHKLTKEIAYKNPVKGKPLPKFQRTLNRYDNDAGYQSYKEEMKELAKAGVFRKESSGILRHLYETKIATPDNLEEGLGQKEEKQRDAEVEPVDFHRSDVSSIGARLLSRTPHTHSINQVTAILHAYVSASPDKMIWLGRRVDGGWDIDTFYCLHPDIRNIKFKKFCSINRKYFTMLRDELSNSLSQLHVIPGVFPKQSATCNLPHSVKSNYEQQPQAEPAVETEVPRYYRAPGSDGSLSKLLQSARKEKELGSEIASKISLFIKDRHRGKIHLNDLKCCCVVFPEFQSYLRAKNISAKIFCGQLSDFLHYGTYYITPKGVGGDVIHDHGEMIQVSRKATVTALYEFIKRAPEMKICAGSILPWDLTTFYITHPKLYKLRPKKLTVEYPHMFRRWVEGEKRFELDCPRAWICAVVGDVTAL
jgi:hypothetical protein